MKTKNNLPIWKNWSEMTKKEKQAYKEKADQLEKSYKKDRLSA